MYRAPIRFRLIVGFCLVSLLGSGLPHFHEPPGGNAREIARPVQTSSTSVSRDSNAETASAPHVRADDAHSDHSNTADVYAETCLVCRSNGNHELARTGTIGFSSLALQYRARANATSPQLRRAIFSGLVPTRAPPVLRVGLALA